jgi:uroporphyrinogen III methyltransferase/synthase
VYLVGAGPGDPGLLTVRAAELLRSADVVAHDKLIPAPILALANPRAERLEVGRRRGDAKQDFVLHPEVLARAQAGLRVVRLKSGDPLMFGRGAEEAQELADAGIPFEIVPGVSAALGAAAYTGIPLTDRRCASSVTFTTGHNGQPGEFQEDEPELASAARGPGTVVLYMATHRLTDNLRRLVDSGRAPATPAAYVEHATGRNQRVIVGTVSDLAGRVTAEGTNGPALVIVGDVVRLRQKVAWTERRPLAGKRVIVARARPGDSQISKELRNLGADVLETPTITVCAASEPGALAERLERLASFGGVMFACEPGVERTLEILRDRAELGDALRKTVVIGVGAAAIATLRRGGLPPRIEALGACREELARHAPRLRLAPILLVASETGRPSLVADLVSIGAVVEVVGAYKLTHRFDEPPRSAPDLVVLPSSSSAAAVVGGPLHSLLAPVPMLAMGPKTEETARRAGARNVVCSRHDSVPSIIAGVLTLLGPIAEPRDRGSRRAGRSTQERSAE